MSDAAGAQATKRQKWQGFAVAVGVASLTILDLSKVNVGLPSIERSLDADSSQLQLIVAGYALAFGLTLVPAGRLGDIYSRKLMFAIGLCAFTAASILCAIAPTIEFLVFARFLQGVAAGIQMPQVIGLTQQLFQGAERGRAFGVFGAVIGLSTAFGPTIGGLLIALGGETDGWRLLFWMNLPLGLVALYFALRLLPKRTTKGVRTELDVFGIVLLGITVLALMVPFLLTTGSPADDPRRWFSLLIFALFAVLFVVWEKRYQRAGKSPVVNLDLLRISSYRNGILVGTSYFAALPATFLITTLYLQQGLDASPVHAGMVSIPFALASAVGAWVSGRLINKYGRILVVLGSATVAVGFTLVLLVAILTPQEQTIWWMAGAMTIAGAGGGFVISPNQTLTLAEIPVSQGGVAGAIGQVGQRVGTAIGVAVASAVFFATLFREAGEPEKLVIYHDGFRNGMLVALSFIVLSLLIGLIDLRSRRKAR